MKTSLIILCCLTSAWSGAQNLFDAMENSFQAKPKPIVSLSSRNAFITNGLVKMRSVFAGINYADVTRIGLTYNWMARGVDRDHSVRLNDSTSVGLSKSLRMRYIAPHIEYTYYRSEHWEAGIHVQLGFGSSFFTYELNNVQETIQRDWIMLYEPAMTIQYRFLQYFGIGAGVGYRLLLKNNKQINERFTSPVYTIGFKVFFSKLYQDYRNDVDNS